MSSEDLYDKCADYLGLIVDKFKPPPVVQQQNPQSQARPHGSQAPRTAGEQQTEREQTTADLLALIQQNYQDESQSHLLTTLVKWHGKVNLDSMVMACARFDWDPRKLEEIKKNCK